MQKDFGQEVRLTVHDKSGKKVLFDAAGLRIDFDVRLINGFSRGTFTIYNLEEKTIKAIANGTNYVTVTTKLHGKQKHIVANSFFISNVLEEKKLPNSVTTLYGYDSLRKQFLEEQVDIDVKLPSLRKEMAEICTAVGFSSKSIIYKSFPEGKVDQLAPRPLSPHHGSLQQCIRRLQNTHKFKFYTVAGEFICVYAPALDEVETTDLSKQVPIVLDVRNLRSDPKIGVATLLVTSNLDGRITPSAVLDTSKLLSVSIDATEEDLQLSKKFLQDYVAGYTLYQALAVQHKGSNYTSEWKTVVTAISPTRGKNMPTLSWHKGA